MALKRMEIELLADKIATNLVSSGYIKLKKDVSFIKSVVRDVLTDDVQKEREIDVKTKELLGEFSREIENERLDNSKLFMMAKRKVAKKEGFLL
jgi:hypothetical protein